MEAIQALEDGDKTSLAKIARLYAGKTPYDHADLLQEAICRVLSGERKWPKDVPPVLFLGGVVRSIAWQWRQKELWAVLGIGRRLDRCAAGVGALLQGGR